MKRAVKHCAIESWWSPVTYTTQLRWLMERTPLKPDAAEQMINSQMPLAEKIRRADHIVWNNGGRAVLHCASASSRRALEKAMDEKLEPQLRSRRL